MRLFSLLTGVFCALTMAAWAQDEKKAQAEAAPAEPAAEIDYDKVSYAIGARIGEGLKRDGVELNAEELMAGVKDGFGGKDLKLSDDEIMQVMTAFQREMQNKMQQEAAAAAAKNSAEGAAFLAENGKKEGIVTTESGLQYQVLKEGEGPKPKTTDTISAHYHGTLLDGTVFDSSVDRGVPASFPVNRVIPGWTEALQLMPVGSKWKLFIPSALAYAERGAGADIGPHATLIFEVELLGIE